MICLATAIPIEGFAVYAHSIFLSSAYSGSLAGGIVVCSGTGCSVTFTNVTFHHCTLVCLAGAQVAVDQCSFVAEMEGPSSGVSVIADGAGTRVVVQGLSLIHISEPTRPY